MNGLSTADAADRRLRFGPNALPEHPPEPLWRRFLRQFNSPLILWINLLTDGLPALALAFDRTPGVMQQRPRPADSPLLDQPSVRFVLAVGTRKAMLALALLGALPTFGYSLEVTRAAAFHFMAVGQLFLTYPSRHTWMRPLSNRYLHAAVVGGIGIQLAAASVPFVSNLLGVRRFLWNLMSTESPMRSSSATLLRQSRVHDRALSGTLGRACTRP